MTESATSYPAGEICGVWIDDEGRAHLSISTATGGREEKTEAFRPFAWLGEAAVAAGLTGIEVETLKGEGTYRCLAHAAARAAYEELVREAPDGAAVDWIRP